MLIDLVPLIPRFIYLHTRLRLTPKTGHFVYCSRLNNVWVCMLAYIDNQTWFTWIHLFSLK